MLTTADLSRLDPRWTGRLPYNFAKRNGVIAACGRDNGIELWTRPETPSSILIEVQRALGQVVWPQPLSAEDFDSALSRAYERGRSDALEIADGDLDLGDLAHQLPRVEDLLESEDDAPIVRLLNALFSQAVRDGASDIHIEPFETRTVVRFRIDGVLRDVLEPPQAAHGVIVSRVKIMAHLDIAEKRMPQDGRIALRLAGRPVDVRVSCLPTAHGERVVMRLLDKHAGQLTLPALGMSPDILSSLDELIHCPHGIILVTGPTGSGKTTTLYAALSQLDTRSHNIMTVEDPIEYDLDGIGQTQTNPRIDLSFARALRAILRQDPDIIMIGEIRDLETAQIAVQASLTGHLVLATLHTNDSVGAVTRLVDMGVEPFLVASSLIGVLAQRLVRRLCPRCRREHVPDAAERRLLQIDPADAAAHLLYATSGCETCNQTGYQGRTGIFELLRVDEPLRSMVHDGAAEAQLREHARARGMTSVREDGLRWVRAGNTSIEEVLRVTRD
ncbi:MAG: type II secretion system ATPase GspE [Burkholderiales bacterium]